MRDSAIAAMDAIRSKREGLILAQFEFLKTRQEAMERVVVSAPWYLRLFWALSPADFLRSVDAVQTVLLKQSKADMKKAAETVKDDGVQVIRTVPMTVIKSSQLVVPCGR